MGAPIMSIPMTTTPWLAAMIVGSTLGCTRQTEPEVPLRVATTDEGDSSPEEEEVEPCSPDGFCLVHGNGAASAGEEGVGNAAITGVWGSGPDRVYAVGIHGRLMRYDGVEWRSLTGSIEIRDLWGVWGTSAEEVLVVGLNGMVSRFDGSEWRDGSVGLVVPMFDVWGSGPSNVLAVGGPRVVLRYNGSEWRALRAPPFRYSGDEPHSPALLGVWGSGPRDVYAVGDGGWAIHWNGRRWRNLPTRTTETLKAVWGPSPEDVYVVGDAGTLLQRTRRGFRREHLHTEVDLWGIWGRGQDDIYVVGEQGTILHWNGRSWRGLSSGVEADLFDLWGCEGHLWVVGDDTILHRRPAATTSPSASTSMLSPSLQRSPTEY
jgi:hypothetical protein